MEVSPANSRPNSISTWIKASCVVASSLFSSRQSLLARHLLDCPCFIILMNRTKNGAQTAVAFIVSFLRNYWRQTLGPLGCILKPPQDTNTQSPRTERNSTPRCWYQEAPGLSSYFEQSFLTSASTVRKLDLGKKKINKNQHQTQLHLFCNDIMSPSSYMLRIEV